MADPIKVGLEEEGCAHCSGYVHDKSLDNDFASSVYFCHVRPGTYTNA
jgi:hypothetical protein